MSCEENRMSLKLFSSSRYGGIRLSEKIRIKYLLKVSVRNEKTLTYRKPVSESYLPAVLCAGDRGDVDWKSVMRRCYVTRGDILYLKLVNHGYMKWNGSCMLPVVHVTDKKAR